MDILPKLKSIVEHPTLDLERQKKAREYSRMQRRLGFGEMGLSLVLLLILILTPVSRWFTGLYSWPVVPSAVVFFLVSLLAYEFLTTPLSYYGGFVLPRRYGLSTQRLKSWMSDLAKGGSLGLILGAATVAMAFWFLADFPSFWWLLAWLAMIIISVIMSIVGPVMLVPIFYKVRPIEDARLKLRLEQMAARAGAKVNGIYTLDFSSKGTTANAALMGIGRTRRIVVSDTLIRQYAAPEIEVVVAHEIGHHLHRDIFRAFVVRSALYLIVFKIADIILVAAPLGFRGISDPAILPLFFLVLGALGTLIAPLSNGYSRHIESQADAYALELTNDPQAFIDSMTRLVNQNLAVADPSRWEELLFYSHPSYNRRVQQGHLFEKKPEF